MQTQEVCAKYNIRSVKELPNYLGHQQEYAQFLKSVVDQLLYN